MADAHATGCTARLPSVKVLQDYPRKNVASSALSADDTRNMSAMSTKKKIIAIIVGLGVAAVTLVSVDMWYATERAESANPPAPEEAQP